jgi:GTP-binding protein
MKWPDTPRELTLQVMGKIQSGRVRVGDTIKALSRGGDTVGTGRVTKLFCQRGLAKVEIEEAGPGDILWLAGIDAGGR